MNPHNTGYRMAEHNFRHADPGSGVPIQYTEWNQVTGLTVAGTETNTLAAPTKAGQRQHIFCEAYSSGARTVTVASAATGAQDTTIVFNAVDDAVTLESFHVGSGVYEWRVTYSEGNPANLGSMLFDDLQVTDDLVVGGTVTVQGTDATVLTLDEGDLVLTLGDISVAAGNLSVATGTATFGATASIATVSTGDGSTNLIPKAQVIGTTKATGGLLIGVGSATDTTAVAPNLAFVKSGGATLATPTAVASGEILGEITWFGADGTDLESPAARIYCAVDDAVGTGDMPGSLVLQTTADGGETLTTAMTIDSDQRVKVNGTLWKAQGAPTAETGAATVTAADIITGIVTITHSAGADAALTLDTGTAMDTALTSLVGTNMTFDWSVINLSAAAADTATLTAAAGHTIVGSGIVQSAHTSTGGTQGNAARFSTRRTATNTWITYRIA